ncbi:MAG: hypothetical protein A3F89_00755 [Deltaproteobacteria bacterium RIFCSPLOWO2_12_FULL_50_11]|nr:MAG: hypothetical protein A3F89_00755 [Deltaproteobacteria bacterium RIFCSPLOWO2_12_FULL_50_11]
MVPMDFSYGRLLRAYTTTLVILHSYGWLGIFRLIVGRDRLREKTLKVHQKNVRRIEKTILSLKGLFIKVGQMLSIMTTFLPESFTEGLQGLQDAVPPHPYSAIEDRFLKDFGKKPTEVFKSFDSRPIASASLGQVHVARLKDDTKVAVKVQYPEIDQIVSQDLRILRRIFYLLHLIFPTYGLKEVYQEIAEIVQKELDYAYEGKNLEMMRENFKTEKDILFPDVYWEYSTSKILTLKFMEGTKVSHLTNLRALGIDTRDVATKIIHSYCKQIFIDGVYHADPHPGNILIQKGKSGHEAKIVLVDFGATARISDQMRQGMTSFVEGLIKRDTRLISASLREMGFVARPDVQEPIDRLVEYFYDKLRNVKIDDWSKIDITKFKHFEDVLEIRKLNISFRDLMGSFHVPKDWILLERAIILAIGVCASLDPALNPAGIVLPYVEKFVLQDRSLSEVIITATKELGMSYLQLPQEIYKTLAKINEGKVKIDLPDVERLSKKLYILGHQLIYGFFASLLGLMGWGLLQGSREDLGRYFLYGSGFFFFVLMISFLKNRNR